MSSGVGQKHGSDLALLWLWHRPVATAPIRHQAWEPPYAAGVTLKYIYICKIRSAIVFCLHLSG